MPRGRGAPRAVAEAVARRSSRRGRALHRPGQSDGERQGVLVVDRGASTGSIWWTRRSPWRPCRPSTFSRRGEMVATVKIIPFAVPRALLERALALAKAARRSSALPRSGPRARRPDPDPSLRASRRACSTRPGEVTERAPGRARLPAGRGEPQRSIGSPISPPPSAAMAGAGDAADRRRLGDHRPARCDPGGDHRLRRRGRCISACRSIPAICCCWAHRRAARAGAARLRPLAQGERLRLGACAG